MEENSKNYVMILSEKQLNVIQEGLEFFSRFISGQVTHLPNSLINYLHNKNISHHSKGITDPLQLFAKVAFDGQNYGVGDPEAPKEKDIAYEIYRDILTLKDNEYREENPEKKHHYSVYQTKRSVRYSGEPEPIIRRVQLDENRYINLIKILGKDL